MSYVKDLMGVAAKWVKLNPSASGMLKLPRVQLEELDDRGFMLEYERELATETDPERADKMRMSLQRLRDLHADMDVQRAKVREAGDQVEYLINEVDTTQQNKYVLDGPDGVSKNTALHGRWCLAWAHAGYNVFELSNDFVAAMLLTDPIGIHFDDLRTPFPGVLITIPSGFVTGVEGLPYTKLHLYYVDGSWGLYATDGVHVLDTHVAEGQVLSWKIFEDLETQDGAIEDVDQRAIQTLRQIAFGMLAYVTAVDRAIEERPFTGPKKHAADRQRARVHDVGRSIKIDPILIKYARAGTREVAFRLKHRFMVRGHYRNQAHGPARRDRKNIWIAPFPKGPEEGAMLVHTYKPETSS